MFDIEKSVAQWRREMTRAGVDDDAALEELESHLRDDFEALTKAGESPAAAFAKAAGRLGRAAAMRVEFGKIEGRRRRPLVAGLAIWGLGAIGLFAVLESHSSRGREDALLLVHTFLVTSGCMAAFVAGGIAAWRAGRAWRGAGPGTTGACDWAAQRFLRAAALLTVGFVAGMAWLKIHLGSYWVGGLGGARAVAICLAIAGLLTAMGAARRLGAARVSFAASVIVSLAWFVPYTFGNSAGYIGFAIFLAVNACCWGLGAGIRSKVVNS